MTKKGSAAFGKVQHRDSDSSPPLEEPRAANGGAQKKELPEEPMIHSRLYRNLRAKWQVAAWEEIVSHDLSSLADDPERGKLAMIVAVAHSSLGNFSDSRTFAQQAIDWGCRTSIVRQLLVSAVYDSLARAAVALQDEQMQTQCFGEALRCGECEGDLTGKIALRRINETARMGLIDEAIRLIEVASETEDLRPFSSRSQLSVLRNKLVSTKAILGRFDRDADADGNSQLRQTNSGFDLVGTDRLDVQACGNPRFCQASHDYYTHDLADRDGQVLYLDVKSLPRSGLHYMQKCLATILHDRLSFCEWYNEPGCCRKMPCALTGYMGRCEKSNASTIVRMIKSHDFELNDPIFPLGKILKRIILVRDPLFILTSWWNLQILQMNQDLLRRHGVEMKQVNFRHDRNVLNSAYHVIANFATLPNTETLWSWLTEKKDYILNFLKKWNSSDAHQLIVPYEQVGKMVVELLSKLENHLPPDVQKRLQDFERNRVANFSARGTPFEGPIPQITQYLEVHAPIFKEIAKEIVEEDSTDLCAEAVNL
ncbi:MAG TPA: hypothetical protein PKD64_08480 [Pirellulaceae bacterium]|nr:hypothetical protein [Pirellulaceae bacterium]HMO92223.1 hypothetical protein [Pirellulaceae bacterium]HMP69394.1 hypothetical protein [Pirellulaceae bacterium]